MIDWTDDELRNILTCGTPSTAWEYQLADILLREREKCSTMSGEMCALNETLCAERDKAEADLGAQAAVLKMALDERDALGVENDALREALVAVTLVDDRNRPYIAAVYDALALDLPRAAAIAETARQVCETAEKVVQMTHSNAEWERESLDRLASALAAYRKAKEGK